MPRNRVSAIIVKDNEILLIHRLRDGQEYWSIPGGGIEENEDIETALNREVLEETGLRVINFDLAFKVNENHTSGVRTNYFFRCTTSADDLRVGGPELERSSPTNIYKLEWIQISKIITLNLALSLEASQKLNNLLKSQPQKSKE
jgi:ADP-ribose pyrophosphatase YjhB (NUDIX family)